MEKYYLAKKITNFKEVVVISVSRGAPLVRFLRNPVDERQLWDKAMAFHSITPRTESVNVTHDVVLGIPNNASAEKLYWEDVEAIVEAVEGLDSCTGECPDFNTTTPPTVTTTEADLGSVCEQFVKDPEVAKYYQLVPIDGKLTCVTVCHNQHSHHKRCYNRGICLVYKTIGPLCECLNVEETWYLNDDCSLPIHRTPFYAGISVTLACLLLIVGVLTAFLLRNKQRQSKRRRDIQEQLVNQWLNEDFEWSRSNSDIHSTGDFNNLAYAHEEAAVHREELEGYRQPAPVDILTGHLDTDDRQLSSSANIHGLDTEYHLPVTPRQHNTLTTNTLSFSTVEHPQSDSLSPPLRDLSRISRPQIRISWDP
uniref:mucin-3A n=1 Tax=Epinephelus lanceolatus TaxID=310571 RepID=UPI001444DC28|nr:mucin-3A [Epinephelus lanceolatus]